MAKPTASSSGGITFGFGMSGFLYISNRKAGLLMMAILFMCIELFIERQGMILPGFYLSHSSFHRLKRIIAQATHPRALSHQAKRRYRKLVLMRRSWTPKNFNSPDELFSKKLFDESSISVLEAKPEANDPS